jgi:hypothetical protein
MAGKRKIYDEFIGDTDVSETVKVKWDKIYYDTWCWPFIREDFAVYEYKLKWDDLLIKCINYSKLRYYSPEYNSWKLVYIKNWKINEKAIEEVNKRHRSVSKDGEDLYSIEDFEKMIKWHKRKYRRYNRFSPEAKKYILEQIKNKE